MAARENTGRALVLRLSLADLWHEWILSLCLMLAVAAILAPLLLLFGLKHGTIETLRYRLIQNPVNREIRPTISRSYSRGWIEALNQRPEVELAIPNTRQLSASVLVRLKGGKQETRMEIVPTAPGDPLLLQNQAPVPGEGQCVLSQEAMRKLGAKTGDTLVVTTARRRGGVYEKGVMELKVAGVADPRATTQGRLFVLLPVLEAMESYKDGEAVPAYGWPGSLPQAYPLYDGAIVAGPQPLDNTLLLSLRINTGFYRSQAMGRDELLKTSGLSFPEKAHTYFLSTLGSGAGASAGRSSPVDEKNLDAVRAKLRGAEAALLPWVAPQKAELIGPGGKALAQLELYALPGGGDLPAEARPAPAPPWPAANKGGGPRRMLMAAPEVKASGEGLSLRLKMGERELVFPVSLSAEASPRAGVSFIPPELAGVLRLGQTRPVRYDPEYQQFLLHRRGYAAFRLYTRSIDQVAGLKEYFESQGIDVHTKAAEILQVKELDRYLSLIFWLIAAVGIAGGAASLVASLYASVERKKRDLAVLRLIGLPRGSLLRFPVYQGVFLAGGGFLAALGFFGALAQTINTLFAAHLHPGESFCRLPWQELAAALAATLGVAALAAVLAAWRVNRIEPAEALRDE